MREEHMFNASKLSPANCAMGEARVRDDGSTVYFTRMLRPFWVDTGVHGGKGFGKKGDYLVIYRGVRRAVSVDMFHINFVITKEEGQS